MQKLQTEKNFSLKIPTCQHLAIRHLLIYSFDLKLVGNNLLSNKYQSDKRRSFFSSFTEHNSLSCCLPNKKVFYLFRKIFWIRPNKCQELLVNFFILFADMCSILEQSSCFSGTMSFLWNANCQQFSCSWHLSAMLSCASFTEKRVCRIDI